MLFRSQYDKKIIEPQIPASEKYLKQFYAENKHKYYQLKQTNIKVLPVSDKSAAERLWEELEGESLSSVRGTKLAQSYQKDLNGKIRSLWGKGDTRIGRQAMQLKVGELAGPIELKKSESPRFAIIECISVTPEMQLPYDSVKDQVARDYMSCQFERIENKEMQKLADTYKIKLYKNVLNRKIRNYTVNKNNDEKEISRQLL